MVSEHKCKMMMYLGIYLSKIIYRSIKFLGNDFKNKYYFKWILKNNNNTILIAKINLLWLL